MTDETLKPSECGSCPPLSGEKDFDLPAPRTARPDQFMVTSLVEFAAQGVLVAAPVQSWVFAAIPLEPVGFQSRHGVRHHLVMPEEHEPAAKSRATEPLDFRPLPSDVARRSNDGAAVLPLDLAALPVRIKVRPDALAQVLDREGVVALVVKYRDERSLDSAETPAHSATVRNSFSVCKRSKRRGGMRVGLRKVYEESPTSFPTDVIAILLSEFWSPIEREQARRAPHLLRFCHIAPQMHVQGECRIDLRIESYSALRRGAV